jgi:hypothetical protein
VDSVIDALILRIRDMKNERWDEKRSLSEVARESAQEMREDNPAAVIVNTALAMNWNWETHAKPRVKRFRREYPNVESFSDLRQLLDSMSEKDFCKRVLDLNITRSRNPRYGLLKALVDGFLRYKKAKRFANDWETIQKWGEHVDLYDLANDPVVGGVNGIGVATVQNIRIISGFNTSKPDRRVIEALKHLGIENPVQIVDLLSELTNIPSIELDQLFWYWLEKHPNGTA